MKKIRLFKICFTCLLFLLTNNLTAQSKLSLDDCYRLLEVQNLDVKQANLEILLNKIEIKDAKNSFLPTLNLGAGHNYNLGLAFDQISGQLVTGNKWSNSASANLSVSIPVFQNFTLRNILKQSILSLESRKLQKVQLLQSLKLQLLTKYVEATANKSLYDVSLQQLDFAKEQLQQEKVKFEIGANTTVDVAQAESTVANNELITINNLTSYKNSLLEVKQLIGIPLTDSLNLKDIELDDSGLSRLLDINLIDKDLKDPTVVVAEIGIKQAELNLKYAKGAYYPSFNLFGSYGTNYSSERKDFITGNYMPFWNQMNQNRSLNFGVSLSIPIFNAFKTKNNINRLKIDLESQHSELYKIKAERQKIFYIALQEYQKSVKEHEVQLIHVAAQQNNLTAVRERYEIGVSNAIEYNKALLDFNLAEANLIKSKYMIVFNIEALKLLRNYESPSYPKEETGK